MPSLAQANSRKDVLTCSNSGLDLGPTPQTFFCFIYLGFRQTEHGYCGSKRTTLV